MPTVIEPVSADFRIAIFVCPRHRTGFLAQFGLEFESVEDRTKNFKKPSKINILDEFLERAMRFRLWLAVGSGCRPITLS